MKMKFYIPTLALSILLPFQICSAQDAGTEKVAPAKEMKKDTPDSLTDELLVAFNKLPSILDKVTDQASAETASKEIEKISTEIGKIAKQLDPLPEPSDEVKARIDKKMETGLKNIGPKMASSMEGLAQNPELLGIIGAAMQKFGTQMAQHEKTFEKYGKGSNKEEGSTQGE